MCRRKAKRDFLSAEGAGEKLCVLSTDLYDEAQAFSEGVHWVAKLGTRLCAAKGIICDGISMGTRTHQLV
jgi:hypothetical protein